MEADFLGVHCFCPHVPHPHPPEAPFSLLGRVCGGLCKKQPQILVPAVPNRPPGLGSHVNT